jgi:hypothetical protein
LVQPYNVFILLCNNQNQTSLCSQFGCQGFLKWTSTTKLKLCVSIFFLLNFLQVHFQYHHNFAFLFFVYSKLFFKQRAHVIPTLIILSSKKIIR